MKLTSLYRYLRRQAATTGRDQAADLFKGARIAVRVQHGETTLTLSRRLKPLGDSELTTFRAHCQVPATAMRWPTEGQHSTTRDGVTYHLVVFRWLDTEATTDAPTPDLALA